MRVVSLCVVGKPKTLIWKRILLESQGRETAFFTIVNESFYFCKTIKVVNFIFIILYS